MVVRSEAYLVIPYTVIGSEFSGAVWGGIINKGVDIAKRLISDYLRDF